MAIIFLKNLRTNLMKWMSVEDLIRKVFHSRTVEVSAKIKDRILRSWMTFTINPQMFESFKEYAINNNMKDRLEKFEIIKVQ